jgi:hypothetical protein
MKAQLVLLLCSSMFVQAASEFGIASFSPSGAMTTSNAFLNGVCTVERAETVTGPWQPAKNIFSTSAVAQASLVVTGANGFFRALARDLSQGRTGFTNLVRSYGVLTTIAGAGGVQDTNNWLPEFEGAPATNVFLSAPHITMADRAGNLYIADKDAHGIRKVRLDGTIITVAGTSSAGNGTNDPAPGTEVALTEPNGLWVRADGTLFILDLGNGKVRRLDTNGTIRTLPNPVLSLVRVRS